MKHAISAILVIGTLALALPAFADPIRPKPRPTLHQIKLEEVVPVASQGRNSQMRLLLIQASSFVSAASMVTGTPLFALPK